MATSTISLLPRVTRVIQAGDQLVADIAQPNGSTLTLRVDASDLFGGMAAAMKSMAVALEQLTTPTIALDAEASIATDGEGNVTHAAQSIALVGRLILPDVIDIAVTGAGEPVAGSKQIFAEGGFLKCAV